MSSNKYDEHNDIDATYVFGMLLTLITIAATMWWVTT